MTHLIVQNLARKRVVPQGVGRAVVVAVLVIVTAAGPVVASILTARATQWLLIVSQPQVVILFLVLVPTGRLILVLSKPVRAVPVLIIAKVAPWCTMFIAPIVPARHAIPIIQVLRQFKTVAEAGGNAREA